MRVGIGASARDRVPAAADGDRTIPVITSRSGSDRGARRAGGRRSLQIACLPRKSDSLDRLGQQSTRPIAQDFGELIVDVFW